MMRVGAGILVGLLLGAALAWGAAANGGADPWTLWRWQGQGERPGLYYYQAAARRGVGAVHFYECRAAGDATVAPPPQRP